jgi:hypothetical protein
MLTHWGSGPLLSANCSGAYKDKQVTVNHMIVGSNPIWAAKYISGHGGQPGSNPAGQSSILWRCANGLVADMVIALV